MKDASFTRLLMRWHTSTNKRIMPWKGEKDPYKIWLSEVILQQTRVEQGWAYYERFIKEYPTVTALAHAAEEKVFKLWEGLGYYNRCKNLLHTAKFIAGELNGEFPSVYEDILALKGVGPYTAAAIASFAFNLPYAVVDGNVFRVLARCFGIHEPVDSTAGVKYFTGLATELLDKKNAGAYNQAIMDFGATVCKPALALCNTCPLCKICIAHEKGIVNHLPIKEKLLQKKNRWFNWFVFSYQNDFFITKRAGRDIWQNLYEFYLVETDDKCDWDTAAINAILAHQLGVQKAVLLNASQVYSQQLTHQHIKARFFAVELGQLPAALKEYKRVNKNQLAEYAFPVIINQYLRQPSVQSALF